jgi:ethanolamine ammonia-lyase small subunit
MSEPRAMPDPWDHLRRHTAARIALGRAGGSLPTKELLKFSYDHAQAQDAVHSELDFDRLQNDLATSGLLAVRVATMVSDRITYLQRPDLGCQLDPESCRSLQPICDANPGGFDVALIVADGLSALAAQSHAPGVVGALAPLLIQDGITIAPITMARYARVALQDQIGQLLRARTCVILLGERPGLGSPDSLGAYLVFNPRPGNTNAMRNCVSNIRPGGLSLDVAVQTLRYIIGESLRRHISGIELKDERAGQLPGKARALE